LFVGKSSEERELSREESRAGVGWSFNPLAAVSAVKNIFTSQTTKTLAASGALGPQAALIARADMAARGVKAAAKGSAPKAAAQAAPAAAAVEEEVASVPAKAAAAVVGWAHDDDQIASYISRERDPEKRQRMLMNHERAKRMRSFTSGNGISEVEEAIGELYARVPIDANRRPYLDAKNVRDIAFHMASKWGGGRPTAAGVVRARKLIATYARVNRIATPGLKVVRA
jgi:hypothetical protein